MYIGFLVFGFVLLVSWFMCFGLKYIFFVDMIGAINGTPGRMLVHCVPLQVLDFRIQVSDFRFRFWSHVLL